MPREPYGPRASLDAASHLVCVYKRYLTRARAQGIEHYRILDCPSMNDTTNSWNRVRKSRASALRRARERMS